MIKFIARRCDSILKIIIFILVSYYGFLITKHIHFDDKTNAFMVQQIGNFSKSRFEPVSKYCPDRSKTTYKFENISIFMVLMI